MLAELQLAVLCAAFAVGAGVCMRDEKGNVFVVFRCGMLLVKDSSWQCYA